MSDAAARPGRTIAPIGDPVPTILAAYYEAIDAGRFDDAAATFGSTALYAVPGPGTIETAPRVETIGAIALRQRLAERGPRPWRHRVELSLAQGTDALVEGLVDHHLLQVHHVRDDLGAPLAWDLAFLASGVVLVAVGWLLHRAGRPDTGRSRTPVGSTAGT